VLGEEVFDAQVQAALNRLIRDLAQELHRLIEVGAGDGVSNRLSPVYNVVN
jgi:hypothetical protein